MGRMARLAGTLLVTVVGMVPVHAADQRNQQSLSANESQQALVNSISVWVGGNFGLPNKSDALLIVRMGSGHRYDHLSRTIYVPRDWSPNVSKDISILVHEITQHLQYVANKRFGCEQERNALPFAAQDAWLAMSEQTLEKEFAITSDVLLLSSQCVP